MKGNSMPNRLAEILLILLLAGSGQPSQAYDAAALKAELPGDKALGDPKAPVVLIEYASLSCPHCALFHVQVLPMIQKEYIDKGKVRYIFRDFSLNGAALFASQVTHCAAKQGGDEKYFAVLKGIMEQQMIWRHGGNARTSLLLLATRQGVDGKELSSCLDEDKTLEYSIVASRKDASEQLGITKVPSFIINGEPVEHMRNQADARKALNAALGQKSPNITKHNGEVP